MGQVTERIDSPVVLDNTILTNLAVVDRADLIKRLWPTMACTTPAILDEYRAGAFRVVVIWPGSWRRACSALGLGRARGGGGGEPAGAFGGGDLGSEEAGVAGSEGQLLTEHMKDTERCRSPAGARHAKVQDRMADVVLDDGAMGPQA